MKILYVADGRSPIALNWMRFFADRGHDVHLASMFPCKPEVTLSSLTVIPLALSGTVVIPEQQITLKSRVLRTLVTPGLRTWIRHRFVPGSIPSAAGKLRNLIDHLQPEVVHAMRIPYEGMAAALAYDIPSRPGTPLLISVWGNDFTLHAPATRRLKELTRLSLERADALHTDCERDQHLAVTWGFDPVKPSVVLPGAGGIQLDTFNPGDAKRAPVVINPRGLRTYIRTDTFFNSLPLVLERYPQARFICPNMSGQREAERWVRFLGIEESVELLPHQTRTKMADLFRQAQVVVSPSTHDGTPNTLLEAMACGCTPVAGDIESIREWITPGVNGLLVDPGDPQLLADAICEALANLELRTRASEVNLAMVRKRAGYEKVMGEAVKFYESIIK
jgi:glycosyltransferase involved in cell wall biosynthesis